MILSRQIANATNATTANNVTNTTDTNIGAIGGGGLLGIDAFPDVLIESLWIAAFTMFIIWLLSLVLGPLASIVNGDDQASPKALKAFARSSRDGFLILLGLVAVTQSGYGATMGVLILDWIIFALLVIWIVKQSVNEVLPSAWWIDSLLFLPIMAISIIVFALAFRGAPSYK